MNKKEFIKRAWDATNGFDSAETEAVAVNPNIWDFKLREYQEANLVVTPLAEQFDFRGAGTDYKVTIDEAPSEAAALTEATDITISAFSTRNVTFDPSEYGAAYQITRNEAARAFFNVAERMTKKLGYGMALKKDSIGLGVIDAGASNTKFVNDRANDAAIVAGDTLDYATIVDASRLIEDDLYMPDTMIVNPSGKQQILDLQSVNHADEFGTRKAVEKGLIGELFGLKIYVTTQIAVASNISHAYILGKTNSGEKAFGYAIKRDPIIEKEYHALGRYWDIVGHEEYDFKVLHGGAICKITHYA